MNADLKKPIVYNYMSFREFLVDSYLYLKSINPRISESAFIQKAGYGANSRGYLKLIKQGKRNISHKGIIGFGKALSLKEKELNYFEHLDHFNQSQNEVDQNYHFNKLQKYIKGRESKAYLLLKSEYDYLSKWYLVAIREMVSLSDFKEDINWIHQRLRREVDRSEIKSAINSLLTLGLLLHDQYSGELVQTEKVIRFEDNFRNFNAVSSFHKQILSKAIQRIDSDQYEDRSVSAVNLTCKKEDFAKIRKEITSFRKKILEEYGSHTQGMENLLSMSIQLIHLTEIPQGDYNE